MADPRLNTIWEIKRSCAKHGIDYSRVEEAALTSSLTLPQAFEIGRRLKEGEKVPETPPSTGECRSDVLAFAHMMESQLQEMRRSIRELSCTRPYTTKQLTAIARTAAGWQDTDNVLYYTATVVDMATVAGVDPVRMAKLLDRWATGARMGTADIHRLCSAVVGACELIPAREVDVLDLGARIITVCWQLHIKPVEVAAMAAGFAALGLPIPTAAQALQTFILAYHQALLAEGDQLETWQELTGMSAYKLQEQRIYDTGMVLVALLRGLERAKVRQTASHRGLWQLMPAAGIGGHPEVMRTLQQAADQWILVGNAREAVLTAWRGDTALAYKAEEMYQTFGSQGKILGNRIRAIPAYLWEDLQALSR